MNWYHFMFRILRTASLYGEWWITESGQAVYADGDVGDMNHEGYVINSIQSQYADDEFNNGDHVDWDRFINSLIHEKIQQAYANPAIMQEVLRIMGISSIDQMSTMDTQELGYALLKERGISEEEINIANGQGDARLFAMKNWGWKRVQKNNVETYNLTSQDLINIVHGLYDAYQEEAETALFNIWVVSNKKWYQNIPLAEMESGNLMNLRQFINV